MKSSAWPAELTVVNQHFYSRSKLDNEIRSNAGRSFKNSATPSPVQAVSSCSAEMKSQVLDLAVKYQMIMEMKWIQDCKQTLIRTWNLRNAI